MRLVRSKAVTSHIKVGLVPAEMEKYRALTILSGSNPGLAALNRFSAELFSLPLVGLALSGIGMHLILKIFLSIVKI